MTKKTNPRNIKMAATLPPKEYTLEEPRPMRRQAQEPASHRFTTIAHEVAQSNIHVGNWYWDGGEIDFPVEPRLWTVDQYYPYAHGGPLLVDRPGAPEDWPVCDRKRKALVKRGFRYVAIGTETTIEDVAKQLEGI